MTHLVGVVAKGDVMIVRPGDDALVAVNVVTEMWECLHLMVDGKSVRKNDK